jgi:hypothetical protein
MTPSSNPQGIVALTGLEPHGGNHEGFEYTTHSGASGSLAANMQTGQIEGMAYGSTKGNDNADTTWQPADTILNLYDVSFNVPVGHETGIYPVETNIIGAPVLRKALTSGRY